MFLKMADSVEVIGSQNASISCTSLKYKLNFNNAFNGNKFSQASI